jgi:hypothetical protein
VSDLGTTRTGTGSSASYPHDPAVEKRREPTYDGLALGLKLALDRLVPCLARAASSFVALRGWVPFGFARVDDFTRERWDRSGRWLRDLAALGNAIDQSPRLADAVLGADGYRPIGQVAALAIGRTATPQSMASWIDLARKVPVRQFNAEIRHARKSGSAWPRGRDVERVITTADKVCRQKNVQSASDNTGRSFSTCGELWRSRDDEGLGRAYLGVPQTVKTSFDRGHALHKAICGRDGGVGSFVESLVGEAYAGPYPPNPLVSQLPNTRNWAELEALLFHNTGQWSHLPDGPRACELDALSVLAEFGELMRRAGRGGAAELCEQMGQLIELQDRIQRKLGKLLALMGHEGGWSKLDFASMGHYVEQRLGISRKTAADRVRLFRVMQRAPLLRDAYESGRIGAEAALLVARALGRGPMAEQLEKEWVERAEQSTLKRLRDEVRVVKSNGKARKPLTNDEWFASQRLAPGDTREKIRQLGLESLDAPMVSLGLTLREDLAVEFLAAVDGWKKALQRDELPHDWAASQVARSFSNRGQPVPQWAGLLAMLEDFAETWDNPEGMPKRKADRIYVRDGWRCTAPGCTSRRNLESHHVVYRSRGGNKTAEWNQATVCRFHHQLGEHGVFAQCRGDAPLGIVWRLGRQELGTWFRNELSVSAGGYS